MQSVNDKTQFNKAVVLSFMTLLVSAIWFGLLDIRVFDAQNTTPTLPPSQQTAIHATIEADMTATAVAVQPIYDDFEAATLDGDKWTDTSDFECEIKPEDGVVSLSTARSNNELNCVLEIATEPVGLNDLGWIEAQVMLKDNHNHLEINQGIEISSDSLSQPIYLFCGINAVDSSPKAVTTGEILANGNLREFYKASENIEVDYNKFYTFRLEVDAANETATCSVNGEVIDVIPLSRTEGIVTAEFVRSISSYRSEGAVGTTCIDNVKLSED